MTTRYIATAPDGATIPCELGKRWGYLPAKAKFAETWTVEFATAAGFVMTEMPETDPEITTEVREQSQIEKDFQALCMQVGFTSKPKEPEIEIELRKLKNTGLEGALLALERAVSLLSKKADLYREVGEWNSWIWDPEYIPPAPE
jgi:hypothetical protein